MSTRDHLAVVVAQHQQEPRHAFRLPPGRVVEALARLQRPRVHAEVREDPAALRVVRDLEGQRAQAGRVEAGHRAGHVLGGGGTMIFFSFLFLYSIFLLLLSFPPKKYTAYHGEITLKKCHTPHPYLGRGQVAHYGIQ